MTAVVLVLVMASVLAAVTVRDHKRLRVSRTSLFNAAAAALDKPKITYCGDGFPKLRGRCNGFEVHADLIPDTMVVRRLPQLWLSVTLLAPDRELPGMGVLVRYAGNEFYSLTTEFKHRLEPPPGLPREVLIRAAKPEAQSLLDELRQPLARLLSDPHVKEVAITAKGLRIVRQAAEGRRGDHLLLRQASFDTTSIPLGEFQAVLTELQALHLAVGQRISARAA